VHGFGSVQAQSETTGISHYGLADFVDEERELMLGLCYRATRAIEEVFDTTREYTTKDGKVFHGGPDHYARLAATALCGTIVTFSSTERVLFLAN
jgi:hypothetical protein